MKTELLDFFRDDQEENGLLVAQAPTGYGKTYQAVQAMYSYLKEGGSRKFLFVTNLLKNLPVEELEKAYKADGREEAFSREVLVLASPVEAIREVIDSTEVPEAFRTPAYDALKQGFAQLTKAHSLGRVLRQTAEEEAMKRLREELEPSFRGEIEARLYRKFGRSPAKKREAIRCDKRYQWIARFYPAVFWNEYKILLLSVKKLMVKNVPLVEPSFPCLSDRMLTDRIICVDEFDASRSVILDHLIDQALHMREDYLELFRQIRSRMAEHRLSHDLLQTRENYEQKSRRKWKDLVQEADEIYAYGALELSLKTATEMVDRGRNFLFHDDSYHTILDENKTHIRVIRNDRTGQVQIHYETREEYNKHLGESRIQLHKLLRDIHVFMRHFQSFVFGWGNTYAVLVSQQKTELEDTYTTALAVETIYRDYGLTTRQISMMMEELDRNSWSSRGSVVAPDLSFYESGFRFFEFIDDEHHRTRTDLQYFQMPNTPEKVLIYLCRRAKVVGLSATAAMETVTGNYDLEYIRARLKEHYHLLSPAAQERIQQELERQWQPYRDGRIQVELTVVDVGKGGRTAEERLNEIFESKVLTRKYLCRLTENEYFQKRYCNIFTAIKEFWTHQDIHAFLCLNKVLPADGKEEMDLALLKDVMEDLRLRVAPDHSGALCVLRSGNDFEEDKRALQEALCAGEKRFILSSYQTLGAGQNLQYPVKSREGLVALADDLLPGDSRLCRKDIDAIYLGDDTHTAVTVGGATVLDSKALLRFFYQAECLHESGEISRKTLNRMIKEGVISYSGRNTKGSVANAVLKQCPSVHRQVSRDMIQAVGRMSRTFLKNPVIYLYMSQKALGSMDPTCLDDCAMTPELQTLATARKAMGLVYSVPDEQRNRAERLANCANGYVQRMLRTTWTQDSMELWNALRRTVLTHPRASAEERERDGVIENYYLYLGEDRQKYYFAQKADFSETVLSVDEDEEAFAAGLEEGLYSSEVSEESARLQTVLLYPGLREHFVRQGWATAFGTGPYMMTPVLFQNIYKGALGEVAGKFILEKELEVQVRELEDPAQFEVFDYTLGNGIYLDFKHWKPHTAFDEARMREKMLRKLEDIGGKRILVINLISDGRSHPSVTQNGRLVEIPGLLRPDGTPDRAALQYVKEMIQ